MVWIGHTFAFRQNSAFLSCFVGIQICRIYANPPENLATNKGKMFDIIFDINYFNLFEFHYLTFLVLNVFGSGCMVPKDLAGSPGD